MHIACLCERLLNQSSSITKLDDANKIINAFKEDYQFLVKILKPLEKIFNIIINDVEIAVIIMIIKKYKNKRNSLNDYSVIKLFLLFYFEYVLITYFLFLS